MTLPPAAPELNDPETELTTLLHFRHMRGLLNGREFGMEAVADEERVPRNRAVAWTFATVSFRAACLSYF